MQAHFSPQNKIINGEKFKIVTLCNCQFWITLQGNLPAEDDCHLPTQVVACLPKLKKI